MGRTGRTHRYEVEVTWTGNTGSGTSGYRDYARDHDVTGVDTPGKPVILGSADPAFRGSPQRWNPEELLVVSLSQCHMLWYLGLCAREGITVTAYSDRPEGTMSENVEGSGNFTDVTLRPQVIITDLERVEDATELHHEAHRMCFIANSVNFPVNATPTVTAPNGD
ncbi:MULTISPECIES: OsmC family protein [unclassified Mycolicibacterium]|uniref:OsmC family protein n=1 Tax=unclassified Mycolicibacterium TaxID=2636767 RepID=UPI0012DD36AB|nr:MULTISPECIES: OsmC family protein [unclassified Mycolicibacterium]MUL82164.1 OsmC family peroxiredoxin [Mycolicibacterium sp. CBMA 329]MUL87930.1 OsmC family peroxiredoxin [Mycolicibacterium sp. CBMA 331]MUM02261.1 OsmC family peroxiredoxin [Mycolicibacterium sp. CBMA 334]MUM26455.1 OsmC family peroxiredoxin [Mycolicibacterium sp. CBMA 295]MUM38227.1 OsmC family peroxiredoxin [Mycolicibacterium sp. CBMA 247]